jgi:carbon starvation protein CstA
MLLNVGTLLLESMKKKYSFIVFMVICLAFIMLPTADIIAQCPMCRMSAESNLENGGSAAKGLNNGILYIFMFPYILVSILGFLWWKNTKKNREQNQEELG